MRTKSMSGGSFLGEMKNLGISIGKDIVRESAPLVKDMLKKKIQKKLAGDMGSGLYAANVGRGGELDTTRPVMRPKPVRPVMGIHRPPEYPAKAFDPSLFRGGAAIEDQQFSLSDVAKTGRRLFGKGTRMRMSAAQLRTLKKGGAIQIKPEMIDEAGRYALSLKPQAEAALNKALSHSKGMRIVKDHLEDLVDLKRGGSIMGKIAMAVAPMLVEKVVDSIVKRTGGAAIEDQQFSLSDVAKTGKRLFGKGVREDAMALYGKYGDDARAAYDTYSPGLRSKVGMGVIQLGSPYADPSNQYGSQMRPFIPTKNPFGAYAPL